ncbi:hypothetical protein GOL85_13290 [Sinorhizobium medicae]|nr:hypothetical protein [Sinorhizobium medicae]
MNYSELQTSLQSWSARSDADVVSEVPNFILFSTAMFNNGQGGVKPLRVREMMAVENLTPVSGVCTLPDDYLQYRRVIELASRRRDLQYVTPTYADQEYSDRASGLSSDFTIIGSSLYMFPLSSNDIELTYYQTIPDLSDAAPTNWLLTKQPNLYLHAGLMQLAMFTKDNDLFSRSAAVVTAVIDGLNSSDWMANMAKAGTRIKGVTP